MRSRCLLLSLLASWGVARSADAQCVYVTGAAPLGTHATEIAVVRDAGTTTMTIASRYEGPAQPFAIVVPIDAAITAADVMSISRDTFLALSMEDAPRLVEYWEQDPCGRYEEHAPVKRSGPKVATRIGERARDGGAPLPAVAAPPEYEVVVPSATEAATLTRWLMDQGYIVSEEVAGLLDPLAKRGVRFLVAKVDPNKLEFEAGHALLAPLRVRWASPVFALPVFTGSDVVVHALGRRQRYEAVNQHDVGVPTNLDVRPSAKDDFDAAYAAFFTDKATHVPDTVVTEYARTLGTCDPCTGPGLTARDLVSLGADANDEWVLTRLHTSNVRGEVVLGPAPPIAGGREFRDGMGELEQGTHASATNQFQARYAVRHSWAQPITCEHPARGRWGPAPQSGVVAPIVAHAITVSAARPQGLGLLEVDASPPTLAITPLAVAQPTPRSPSGCNTGGAQRWPLWAPIVAWIVIKRRRREIVSLPDA